MEEQDIILFVFANKEIPGKVISRTQNGSLFIEPLVNGIPLRDGGTATNFFANRRDAGDADRGDFITFMWTKPGERGINPSTGEPDKPGAKNVTVVSEEDTKKIIDDILNLVANQEKERLKKSQDELEQTYQVKQDELEREKENLNQKNQVLDQSYLDLNDKREYLERERELVQKEKLELINFKQEIDRYKGLLTLVENREKDITSEPVSVPKNANLEPEDLSRRWIEMLESKNQILPESIAIGYLICTITALCSGSMVLLNGTVGVGKSSIVRKSAKLLGGNSEIIPIRPSWLDPSDLLGFFDPLSETFRPSSFTTALKKAANSPDRPFFICLDELNLARIENYGADLLSTLEYSKDKVGAEDKKQTLSLYSQDIENHLFEKLSLLKAEEHPSIDQKLLMSQLDRTLSTMSSECEIPQNLILVGTLNSDETTYDLSPKVIDRSYVITYPLVDFKAILSKEKNNIKEQLSISKFQEKVRMCIDCMDENAKLLPPFLVDTADIPSRINDSWREDWARIIKWNKDYISHLGIPLGHRVKRDYQIFFAVSHCLGITKDNQNRCLSYFILSKLLPRISFFKDKDKRLENLCQQWIEEIRKDYLIGAESYILDELERQISDSGRRNVRYWG